MTTATLDKPVTEEGSGFASDATTVRDLLTRARKQLVSMDEGQYDKAIKSIDETIDFLSWGAGRPHGQLSEYDSPNT